MFQTPSTENAPPGSNIGKLVPCRGPRYARRHHTAANWSRDQVEARLANIPPCLTGMEACVGA